MEQPNNYGTLNVNKGVRKEQKVIRQQRIITDHVINVAPAFNTHSLQ